MSTTFLPFPGQESTRIVVQDVLRARHERRRSADVAEIARRTQGGVSLDDGDGPLVDPGPFTPNTRVEGVGIRCRILSAKQLRTIRAAVTVGLQGILDARDKGAVAMAAAANSLFDARRTLLEESIVEIDGLPDIKAPLTPIMLDALERANLVVPLYEAASDFQDMPEGKVSRSG